MCLPARQQRALDDIESALEARYPHLTAMFATFTRLTRGEELASTERLPRRGYLPRGVLAVLPAAAVMAFLAGLLIAISLNSMAACATTARSGARHAACAAQPSPPADRGGYGGFPGFPPGPK